MGRLSPTRRQVAHVLRTRSPVALAGPLDLHVLSTPPAFVLSQDQTLQEEFNQLSRTAHNTHYWTIMRRSGIINSCLKSLTGRHEPASSNAIPPHAFSLDCQSAESVRSAHCARLTAPRLVPYPGETPMIACQSPQSTPNPDFLHRTSRAPAAAPPSLRRPRRPHPESARSGPP